jgi:hypothetical protein
MSSILGLWKLVPSVVVAVFLVWFLSACIVGLLVEALINAEKTPPPVETLHIEGSHADQDAD